DNLRVLLKLSEHLISQWVGDLRIHAGVPDIAMSQVIGYILDTSTGFKEVHSNGMAQRVNISRAESCCLSIVGKQMLNHAFLHGALPSSEEIWGSNSRRGLKCLNFNALFFELS